ncbi:type II secretion system protein GspL [Pseudomonas sp. LD120]|uniref:type II secretion system protein GspL n=1 Tax=Pseudomonas sp. LD120 TaxID=485751 RepID=UPI0013599BEF|nr:type II secretion system protein GspL [Pseudomonas sp. LD120]KAF0866345.1 type II secretion system protein GspL [Pseudomonas sp. LD120]
MSRLRIGLPPLAQLSLHSPVAFARLDRAGRVLEVGNRALAQLRQGRQAIALECYLHPVDSLLTCIELPPLPAARIKAAVSCAAQALILGPSESMHVAHGARDAQGQVALSWLPKTALQALGRLLQQAGLKLEGLYPAPYALAVPEPGQVNLCRVDDYWLLRQSIEQGSVQPWMDEPLAQVHASERELRWIGDDAPAPLQALSAVHRWSGKPPAWGLHGGAVADSAAAKGWGRALGSLALALLVWVVGLNLYASREAEQGRRLKTQMSQRVQQVFPELPVVLNPLQQARQQLAARQSGAADPSQGFANLVRQAGNAMPFIAGSVQGLSFANNRLQLELLADTPNSADDAWQQALAKAGYSAQHQGNGWTLGPIAAPVADALETVTEDDHE